MKKLILVLLAAFLYALPANATITPGVACTPASATSCTLSGTPAYGDLMVAWAYKTATTAPTTPTGWNVIKTASGSGNSYKLAWKFSLGNETTCGTWTGATQTFCQVYKGGWITGTGWSATSTPSGSAATSSTTVTYPTITLQNPLSTSWVVCGGGSTTSTGIDVTPSGTQATTLRSGTTVTNIAFFDTNAAVTAWASHTTTVTSTSWSSACFEMVGTPATGTLTDYLVNTTYYGGTSPSNGCTGACILDLPIPSTLASNFLRVWFAVEYTTTAPTITSIYCNSDTAHATWTFTQAQHINNAGNADDVYDYYISGAAAGCTAVHVDFGTNTWNIAAALTQQFYNVGTLDTSAGQSSTAPYMTAGTLTPTQTGDIIVQSCTTSTMYTTATGDYTSGGVSLLHSDRNAGITHTAFVETGSAALTPNEYLIGTSGNSVCTSLAIKASAGTGTAPSGVYPLSFSNVTVGVGSTNVVQTSTLSTGNARVLVSDGSQAGSATQWSTIADTLGTTYSTYKPTDAGGGYPNWAIDCNSTAGNDVLTFTGVPAVGMNYWIAEIVGLDHSSTSACYDSGVSSFSSAGSGATATAMPSITPTTSGGIVFASSQMGVGAYPTTVTGPTGATFAFANYTGQTDSSNMGLGNMGGWVKNASTAAKSWDWSNGGSTSWQGSAIALKQAAAGGVIRRRVWVAQ